MRNPKSYKWSLDNLGLSTIAIGLVLFATPSFAHDQPEALKAVKAFVAQYEKLFDAKDVAGIVAMFSADGVDAGPGPVLTSRADIEKRFVAIFDSGASDLRYDIRQVGVAGDLVFSVGQYTVKTKDGSTASGNGVSIYEWDGNALKYRVHTNNFAPPTK
jgi:ketosteroid isomerase-like protein